MKNDKLSILLVDDDEVDVMSVQRAFQKVNITNPLYVAANGLEALRLLQGDGVSPPPPRPAIILLDLNMPKMGGIEFLTELRADPALRSITVVVLTTSNEESDKVQAYDLNVAGYIIKPVTSSKFVESMATFDKYWTLSEMP
jgi:CheY-like chemotaxis protein